MAWFRCSTGGGGGGETDVNLIVTCSPNFAGSTISLTNGSQTYTQTCPSASPYTVTFENIEKGTWTISGVASGQTFTETVIISDYTAQLSDIPDGATVTPVNDIQIWLHCANIWNKTYTTINQVLADTSTLLALISSNNAADYMARSTNWANSTVANSTAMGYIGNNDYCAEALLSNSTWSTAICNSTYYEMVLNKKVPTMTSNTTPSGEVITYKTSSMSQASDMYMIFDGNDNTYAYTTNADISGDPSESYVGYDFGSSVMIKKVRAVDTYNSSYSPAFGIKTLEVLGSNDKSSWTSLGSVNNPSNVSDVSGVLANNALKFRYIIIKTHLQNTSGTYAQITTAQLWGR